MANLTKMAMHCLMCCDKLTKQVKEILVYLISRLTVRTWVLRCYVHMYIALFTQYYVEFMVLIIDLETRIPITIAAH